MGDSTQTARRFTAAAAGMTYGGEVLLSKIEKIAGVKMARKYDLGAPKGVAGRNSDNTFIKKVLGWEPGTSLNEGLAATYKWIKEQYYSRKAGKRVGVG